ncbi:hypothetical protein U472_03510 [Orenia metallireducens]|uniref:Uncharacterized protein n=1 Tax=Orenia metallireducens TaxID=1413210 RepID=A0A1C0AB73_9FIRM|nr:hypothetical protein [Orenia metallireducens]OCL27629.1 hypothetical protein U472_03510 [Orenia metallireducens]
MDKDKVRQIYKLGTSYLGKLDYNIDDKSEEFVLSALVNSIREEINEISKEGESSFSEFMNFINMYSDKAISIFGAGNFGVSILDFIQDFNYNNKTNIQIKFFLDNNSCKWGEELRGIKILEPKLEILKSVDRIIIASTWKKEIKKQLLKMGVRKNKIISIF